MRRGRARFRCLEVVRYPHPLCHPNLPSPVCFFFWWWELRSYTPCRSFLYLVHCYRITPHRLSLLVLSRSGSEASGRGGEDAESLEIPFHPLFLIPLCLRLLKEILEDNRENRHGRRGHKHRDSNTTS